MNLANRSILLVEDDPNDVFLIERAFNKAELDVDLHVARNGEEAMAYLDGIAPYADRDANPLPALILLDLKVPRASGLELLDWLRNHPSLRRLPTLVLSSSNARGDVDSAYERGANSYFVKPLDFADLVDMVRSIDVYWRRHVRLPDYA